jgi:hypothetical protein
MEAGASLKTQKGKEVKRTMQTQKIEGTGTNGILKLNEKSHLKKDGSLLTHPNTSTFDPMKYMLKLPKTKKVQLSNGRVKYEHTEADYLPVAARIAWFRREHPDWSIITETEELANKGVLMKAFIRNADKRIIATARKKETEIGFPDYIEKAETGAVGRALAMCGYGTLQAPEFDEGERIADSPVEKTSESN